jgi:hypothetical protein
MGHPNLVCRKSSGVKKEELELVYSKTMRTIEIVLVM